MHDDFLWSDAWFLTALARCDDAPVGLAAVIGSADMLQHAVMTRNDEINGALGRLQRAGYVIREADGTLRLGSRRDEVLAALPESSSLRACQDRIERLLSSAAWSADVDPRAAIGHEAEIVSEDEYHAATRR